MDEWLIQKRTCAGTGSPTQYALNRYTSANVDYTELLVYPEATTSTTMYFTWESYPLILTSLSQVPEWPDRRKWLLFEALRMRLAQDDRDVRGAILYGQEFMVKVARAMSGSRLSSRPIIVQPITKPVTLRSCEKVITS